MNMLLSEVEPTLRQKLLEIEFSDRGKLLPDVVEGKFGEIRVVDQGPEHGLGRHLVVKSPSFRKFSTRDEGYKALGQAVRELTKCYEVLSYGGVQRFIDATIFLGWPFLWMKRRAGTLNDLYNSNLFDARNSISALIQIAHTLNYCYRRGLKAHQDLKPANILYDENRFSAAGEREGSFGDFRFFVADFGLADAFLEDGRNTGSRPYMSPEQYSSELIMDGRAIDAFAFGVISHECFSGGIHPIGQTTTDVWPDRGGKWDHQTVWKQWATSEIKDVSPAARSVHSWGVPALAGLITKCLSVDPSQRPSMIQIENELMDALEEVDNKTAGGMQAWLSNLDNLAGDTEWLHMKERLHSLCRIYANRDG